MRKHYCLVDIYSPWAHMLHVSFITKRVHTETLKINIYKETIPPG